MNKSKFPIRFAWCMATLYLLLCLFLHGDEVRNIFRTTLTRCFAVVLPVLFPYMVLARLMVSLELLTPFIRLMQRITHCSIPYKIPVVVLLGNLCGYPVGAAECANLVRQNKLEPGTAGIVCALASHGNPIYLVQIAGLFYWKSAAFGWVLFCAQVLFTIASSLFFIKRTDSRLWNGQHTYETFIGKKPSAASVFASALSDSAAACVSICGTIVFFSIIASFLPPIPEIVAATLSGILEFTSGVEAGAAYGGITGAAITGFAVGFGGFSVLTQIADRLHGTEISMRYTFYLKVLEGVWMAASASLFYGIIPSVTNSSSTAAGAEVQSGLFILAGWSIFTSGLFSVVTSWWKKKEFCFPHR